MSKFEAINLLHCPRHTYHILDIHRFQYISTIGACHWKVEWIADLFPGTRLGNLNKRLSCWEWITLKQFAQVGRLTCSKPPASWTHSQILYRSSFLPPSTGSICSIVLCIQSNLHHELNCRNRDPTLGEKSIFYPWRLWNSLSSPMKRLYSGVLCIASSSCDIAEKWTDPDAMSGSNHQYLARIANLVSDDPRDQNLPVLYSQKLWR